MESFCGKPDGAAAEICGFFDLKFLEEFWSRRSRNFKSAALGRHGKPTPFVQVTPGTHEPYFQAEKARMRAGAVSGSRAQVLSRRATITRTATGDRLMSYQDA